MFFVYCPNANIAQQWTKNSFFLRWLCILFVISVTIYLSSDNLVKLEWDRQKKKSINSLNVHFISTNPCFRNLVHVLQYGVETKTVSVKGIFIKL